MKLCKRIAVFGIAMLMSFSTFSNVTYAANDTEAAAYGFKVDTQQYKDTVWYNTITTNVKSGGDIIGVCTTSIGMTRTEKSVSGGKYLDQVFVKTTMKGKKPKSNKAGYSEHLTISSKLPSSASLVAYSPESKAGMKSYNIGVDVDGISGSTTVTKKALEINNYSDTSARLAKICYDYENNWCLPSGYNTYGKYAYNESIQRMHFSMKTSNSRYNMALKVKPKFEEMDGTGYWTFTRNKFFSVDLTINFKTPY